MLEVCHDDISMPFQYGQSNEDVEVAAIKVGPKSLPEPQDVIPLKLPFVPNQQHAEEEKEIGRIGILEMKIELRIHELHQLIEGEELFSHARLVAKEIPLLCIC
jgi:hypothetical protein